MEFKTPELKDATLEITVSPTDEGNVLINFSTPLSAIELNPEDAQDFALTILDQVEATKKPRESLN